MDSYQGVERRQAPRRTMKDRRTMVRWEPNNDDRRQSYGRRKDDERNFSLYPFG